MVLVPTRELAMQVNEVLSPLAGPPACPRSWSPAACPTPRSCGRSQRGVDIVIATPGRLIDLMEQGAVDLSRVEITVLDEADHMADLGFMPDVTTILDSVPPRRAAAAVLRDARRRRRPARQQYLTTRSPTRSTPPRPASRPWLTTCSTSRPRTRRR